MRRFALAPLVLAAAALVPLVACRRDRGPVVAETDSTLTLGEAGSLASSVRSFSVGGRPILLTRLNGAVEVDYADVREANVVFTERTPGGKAPSTPVVSVLTGPQVRFTVSRRNVEGNPVDAKLVVPRGTRVEVRADAGTVVVRDPDGPVLVRLTNGTVQVTGARGALTLDTDNGTLDATMADLTAPLRLRTRNGSISLALPEAASGTLSALSGAGRVDVEGFPLPPPRSVEGGQRLEAQLGRGGPHVSLLATNGFIRLGTPGAAPADSAAAPADSAAARHAR